VTVSLEQLQRWVLSPNPLVRRMVVSGALILGALVITLLVGVAGPLVALALGVALVGGAMILADTHWGFVALAAVLFGLPFASLPFSIGFKPTFLDLALGALFFVWVFKLAIGKERRFIASPLGGFVAAFMALVLFSFALGLVHSPQSVYRAPVCRDSVGHCALFCHSEQRPYRKRSAVDYALAIVGRMGRGHVGGALLCHPYRLDSRHPQPASAL
jgi:hypothetical protein